MAADQPTKTIGKGGCVVRWRIWRVLRAHVARKKETIGPPMFCASHFSLPWRLSGIFGSARARITSARWLFFVTIFYIWPSVVLISKLKKKSGGNNWRNTLCVLGLISPLNHVRFRTASQLEQENNSLDFVAFLFPSIFSHHHFVTAGVLKLICQDACFTLQSSLCSIFSSVRFKSYKDGTSVAPIFLVFCREERESIIGAHTERQDNQHWMYVQHRNRKRISKEVTFTNKNRKITISTRICF